MFYYFRCHVDSRKRRHWTGVVSLRTPRTGIPDSNILIKFRGKFSVKMPDNVERACFDWTPSIEVIFLHVPLVAHPSPHQNVKKKSKIRDAIIHYSRLSLLAESRTYMPVYSETADCITMLHNHANTIELSNAHLCCFS